MTGCSGARSPGRVPLMTVGVLVPAHLGGPLNGCCCCILYSASEFMFASFSCDVRSSVCDK